MTLNAFYPWIAATALALGAGLCGYVASLCGHIADLIGLHCRRCGHTHLAQQQPRWRAQRRLYWALSLSLASGALAFATIAVGWG